MNPEQLGGRLPLLRADELNETQRAVYEAAKKSQVAKAEATGYVAILSDGKLIGPFNALLREPILARALGQWSEAIANEGQLHFSDCVKEVVILSVGVYWKADYVIYAHSIAARKAGVSKDDIANVLRGSQPQSPADVLVAYRLTSQLLMGAVDQTLYAEALGQFGEAGIVMLVALIGQYTHTAILLKCFSVPAPEEARI